MISTITLPGILFFALLIHISVISTAQNYKAVNTDASSYFYDSVSMDIIPVRIDSVAFVGSETHYYAMRQIRYTDYGCFIPNGASWLGGVITENAEGSFQFVVDPFVPEDSSDIFTIKSQAVVGENWRFYNYHTTNHYVEAKVVQTTQLNFIGISDSVKTILLQRKDASGQDVGDPVNGEKILLSKNYGLIRLPKFDDFNSNLRFYDLCGKTNPVIGRTNLTFGEIFDFQPGDEFHIQYLYTPYVYYYPTEEGSVIQTILEKIPGSSSDTLIYRIAECKNNLHKSGMNAPVYTHTSDTIIKQFYLSDYQVLISEPKEPYILNDGMEYLSDNNMGMSANSFMNLQGIPWKFTDASGILWNWNQPGCWNYATYDDYTPQSFHYKGLGGPYYSWMGFNITFNYNKLVYYKKNAETWGTPLNCDSLLQVSLHEYSQNHSINIFPNPTSGLITVSAPEKIIFPCKVELFDISGRLTKEYIMSTQSQVFDLGNLPAGMYSAKFISFSGNIFHAKIVKR